MVQAVLCVPKRRAEEDTMAPLEPPLSLSSRSARGSEEAQSRWEFWRVPQSMEKQWGSDAGPAGPAAGPTVAADSGCGFKMGAEHVV